jgi:hypothetical protein
MISGDIIQEAESNQFSDNYNSDSYLNDNQALDLNKLPEKNRYSCKGEELFYMHKDLRHKREEIHRKSSIEKEMRELEYCTFTPEIHTFDKKENTAELNRQFFYTYVDRIRNYRENNKQWKEKCVMRSGCGKIWKKEITIPKEISTASPEFSRRYKESPKRLSLTESPKKKKSISCTSSPYALKELIEITTTEGVRIEQPMKYKKAINFLHKMLHEIKL